MLRIKECRKRIGIRQVDLARATGISTVTLSRYENFETEPRLSDLQKIAGALSCTVGELIGEAPDVNPICPLRRQQREVPEQGENLQAQQRG